MKLQFSHEDKDEFEQGLIPSKNLFPTSSSTMRRAANGEICKQKRADHDHAHWTASGDFVLSVFDAFFCSNQYKDEY